MNIQQKQKLMIKAFLTIFLVFTVTLQFSNKGNFGNMGVIVDDEQNMNIKSAADEIVIIDGNIASYSSSGTGASGDPYIIKDLDVTTSDTSAIRFNSVSLYFILRDSYLNGSTFGVYLDNVVSGRAVIINNTIIGAISVGSANGGYDTLYNNTIITGQGVNLEGGLNATKNIFHASEKYATLIILNDDNNILKDNIFYGDNSDVEVESIFDSTVENNVLIGASFYFGECDAAEVGSNTFNNNIINGKPLGLLHNRTDEVITGNQYGQLALVNSSNIVIENYDISNVGTAISVANCSDILIKDTSVSSKIGVYVFNTEGFTVENSDFIDCGLYMEENVEIIIHNNYFSSPNTGIYGYEINLLQISNNTFNNASEYGMELQEVSNATIIYNIITTFILLEGDEIPIFIDGAENLTIYYNIFISTGDQNAYLATGQSTGITWYNTVSQIGNYWSNWDGSGSYVINAGGGEDDEYPFIDFDGDNLNETLEVLEYGTDPFNADSDNDGLDDDEEINTHHTNPLSNDSDSDGLDDNEEINAHNTNPTNNDTDSDGLPDGYEVDNSFAPLVDDASEDADLDDLTNLEEYKLGTDPNNNDTDSDGLPDGYEVDNSFAPLVDDASEDADDDGLTNFEEYNLGTNPHLNDTDGDEFSDFEEFEEGTDPLDAESYPKSSLGLIFGLLGGVVVIGASLGFAYKKKWIKIPSKLQ